MPPKNGLGCVQWVRWSAVGRRMTASPSSPGTTSVAWTRRLGGCWLRYGPTGALRTPCAGALDVTFREDQSRVCKDHGPQNLATLRQISQNLLKRETSLKEGIQGKRPRAGWPEDYLLKVLLGYDANALFVRAFRLSFQGFLEHCFVNGKNWKIVGFR